MTVDAAGHVRHLVAGWQCVGGCRAFHEGATPMDECSCGEPVVRASRWLRADGARHEVGRPPDAAS